MAPAACRGPLALDRERGADRPRLRAPARDEAVAAAPAPLRGGRGGEAAQAVFEFALRDPGWQAPAHGRWVGRDELGALRLRDEGQRELLARVPHLARAGRGPPEDRAPWARSGWLEDVRAWLEPTAGAARPLAPRRRTEEAVEHLLGARGSRRTARTSTSRSRRRLPLFVEEASVTAMLAERFPGYVPAPLAVEPERGWFLLPEFDRPDRVAAAARRARGAVSPVRRATAALGRPHRRAAR